MSIPATFAPLSHCQNTSSLVKYHVVTSPRLLFFFRPHFALGDSMRIEGASARRDDRRGLGRRRRARPAPRCTASPSCVGPIARRSVPRRIRRRSPSRANVTSPRHDPIVAHRPEWAWSITRRARTFLSRVAAVGFSPPRPANHPVHFRHPHPAESPGRARVPDPNETRNFDQREPARDAGRHHRGRPAR